LAARPAHTARRQGHRLFTDADRATARARLAPQLKAIQDRKDASRARIDARRSKLPRGLDELRRHAALATGPEEAIAINTAILGQDPDDAVALNRLGRAYEAIGAIEQAKETFQTAVANDPDNQIARRRLRDLERRAVGRR
jgi:tetratricopeptide (TPR) repeat protein